MTKVCYLINGQLLIDEIKNVLCVIWDHEYLEVQTEEKFIFYNKTNIVSFSFNKDLKNKD